MTYRELKKSYEEQTGKKVSLQKISKLANELGRLPSFEELSATRQTGRPSKFNNTFVERGVFCLSQLLNELNGFHFSDAISYEVDKEYSIYRYKNGDILLCVYYKKLQDEEVNEKILFKSVFLNKENDGMFTIHHFDNKCLPSLIVWRLYKNSILLDCFVNGKRLFDDLIVNQQEKRATNDDRWCII